MPYSFTLLRKIVVAALLPALAGCSRSSVVMTPENTSLAEDSSVQKAVARAQVEDAEPAPFTFPDDAGGILLAKVLPPKDLETPHSDRRRAPHRSIRSSFDGPPSLPLPSTLATLPRLKDGGKHSVLRPRLVAEETLGSSTDALPLPQTPALPDTGRIRVPSADVNRPIPLPILAHPVSDRASLDDPTLDASSTAALAAPMPPRTNKAPFLKQTLPDPYDHRRTDALSPEESKEFPLSSPQTPRR